MSLYKSLKNKSERFRDFYNNNFFEGDAYKGPVMLRMLLEIGETRAIQEGVAMRTESVYLPSAKVHTDTKLGALFKNADTFFAIGLPVRVVVFDVDGSELEIKHPFASTDNIERVFLTGREHYNRLALNYLEADKEEVRDFKEGPGTERETPTPTSILNGTKIQYAGNEYTVTERDGLPVVLKKDGSEMGEGPWKKDILEKHKELKTNG